MSKKLLILIVLITFFGVYNYWVYSNSQPLSKPGLTPLALEGQQLWQNNNCNSCHQFYGLGGYLGPDLTNVYSTKGEAYIHAILNSGISTMPQFNFNDEDKQKIIAFLKEVDNTGYYPDKNSIIHKNGWVEIKEK